MEKNKKKKANSLCHQLWVASSFQRNDKGKYVNLFTLLSSLTPVQISLSHTHISHKPPHHLRSHHTIVFNLSRSDLHHTTIHRPRPPPPLSCRPQTSTTQPSRFVFLRDGERRNKVAGSELWCR